MGFSGKRVLALAVSFVATGSLLNCFPPAVLAADKEKKEAPKSYVPQKPSKASKAGQVFIAKNQCNMCHTIAGKGGCIAPPLDGIGARRSRDFLISRITDEDKEEQKFLEQYGESELMPHVRIPRSESTKIVSYLLTLPGREIKMVGHKSKSGLNQEKKRKLEKQLSTAKKLPRNEFEKDVERGKRLVAEKGCQACHSIGNIGGDFGPSLDHVGSRKDINEIAETILAAELVSLSDSREYGKKPVRMPASELSIGQIRSISRFLETLK